MEAELSYYSYVLQWSELVFVSQSRLKKLVKEAVAPARLLHGYSMAIWAHRKVSPRQQGIPSLLNVDEGRPHVGRVLHTN